MPSKSLDAFLILKSESVIYSLNLDQSKFVFTILLACSCRDVVGFWVFFFDMGSVCFTSIVLIFELMNLYIPGDKRQPVEPCDVDPTADKVFIL